MNTQTMLFKGPEFHPGLNVTVRNGLKWSAVLPGTQLNLVKTDEEDKVLGTATVVATQCCSWDMLPDFWLKFEHASGARTREGLKYAMDRAYGEGQWGENLTVVFFWVN